MEHLCAWAGSAALAICLITYVDAWFGSRHAVAAFAESAAEAGDPLPGTPSGPPERGTPVGLLKIERLELEVPVFYGTDPITLNRGGGLVEGSDLPGEDGHVVVSAHRDSFFRPLEHLRVGDIVELHSLTGMQQFSVERIFITDPLDVGVLDEAGRAMLTLITCYPFYYVGFAPERFIVKAAPRPLGPAVAPSLDAR